VELQLIRKKKNLMIIFNSLLKYQKSDGSVSL
jgi:hypothetical protein